MKTLTRRKLKPSETKPTIEIGLIQFPDSDKHSIVANALRTYAGALKLVSGWELKFNSNPEDFVRYINRAGLPKFYDGHCLDDVINQGLIALGRIDDAAGFGRRTGKMPSCWRDWAQRMETAERKTSGSVLELQQNNKTIEPRHVWGRNLLDDFEELKSKTDEVEKWLNGLAKSVEDAAPKQNKKITGYCSPAQIAELHKLPPDRVRKRLERHRAKDHKGWIENEARSSQREPQFLYDVDEPWVKLIIEDMISSQTRRTNMSNELRVKKLLSPFTR
ncbi:MAG TPA: hypothetical protein VMG59_06845 [Phycisphaerae bacterium]|nr:hypothetical protein [Phycisphaerae bacterium]